MTDTFRDLVRRMREAQKQYFASCRDADSPFRREYLTESKRLEREVDKALSEQEETLF
ncbi:MAG TPA: hypothetical protein VMS08_06145 [Candidatus Saccharimonadia bacterium]|nr:hypothetical protein [Candidatus Saccharimonadia bacterium]